MQAVKVSSKGQLVIPKEIRDNLGMAPGTLVMVKAEGESVVLTPMRTTPARALFGSLKDAPLLEELELERRKERERDGGGAENARGL